MAFSCNSHSVRVTAGSVEQADGEVGPVVAVQLNQMSRLRRHQRRDGRRHALSVITDGRPRQTGILSDSLLEPLHRTAISTDNAASRLVAATNAGDALQYDGVQLIDVMRTRSLPHFGVTHLTKQYCLNSSHTWTIISLQIWYHQNDVIFLTE